MSQHEEVGECQDKSNIWSGLGDWGQLRLETRIPNGCYEEWEICKNEIISQINKVGQKNKTKTKNQGGDHGLICEKKANRGESLCVKMLLVEKYIRSNINSDLKGRDGGLGITMPLL